MAWIRINLPFTKWANPFTPCRFVVKWFAWSSGTCGKLYSPCWNSFWGQALTETFQGINLRVWYTTRGWTWTWRFIKILLKWGRSRGWITDYSRTWLYHGCAGQLGVIRITSTSSALTFNRTSLSLKKGEKHTVASIVFNSVETSVFNICCWAVLIYFPQWNTLGDSSHSFEFWKFLKAQSALKFNLSRRYSVVSMISLVIANYQISLEMAIFIIYERALVIADLEMNWFEIEHF